MVKQTIVIRTDLKVRKGKMMAQVAHASLACVLDMMHKQPYNGLITMEPGGKIEIKDSFTEKWTLELLIDTPLYKWLKGPFKKIVLGVNSEEELLNLYEQCKKANLPVVLITDSGLTEFNNIPTNTCIGIGPYWSEEIDKLTKNLKLQ